MYSPIGTTKEENRGCIQIDTSWQFVSSLLQQVATLPGKNMPEPQFPLKPIVPSFRSGLYPSTYAPASFCHLMGGHANRGEGEKKVDPTKNFATVTPHILQTTIANRSLSLSPTTEEQLSAYLWIALWFEQTPPPIKHPPGLLTPDAPILHCCERFLPAGRFAQHSTAPLTER